MENGGIMKSFDEFKSEFRDKLLNELEKRIKMPLDCKRHDIRRVRSSSFLTAYMKHVQGGTMITR